MPSKELFRGLFFFFYPQPALFRINGVKAKAAQRFGATIESALSLRTTHILVARESTQTQALWRLIGRSRLDASCVILDNEWCSQCIESGRLLDTAPYIVPNKKEAALGLSSKSSSPESRLEPAASKSGELREPSSPAGSAVPRAQQKRSAESLFLPTSPSKAPHMPLRAHRENASSIHFSRNTSSAPPLSPPSPLSSVRERTTMRTSLPAPPRSPLLCSNSRSPSPPLGLPESSPEPGGSPSAHPNQALLDLFHEFAVSRKASGGEFSARAYERAIKVLEETTVPLTGYADAIKLPGLTEKMAQLVDDVLHGVLPASMLDDMKQKAAVLALFETVYGVGATTARALYDKGCRTLEDITPLVDDNGRYSIAHHADFLERMDRREVAQHYEKVKELVAAIDAEVQTYCMGSYRRGEKDCGDIDIILTCEGASIRKLWKIMRPLLDKMFATGLATYTFSTGGTRWLGASQVDGKIRRMDILLVPWQELGAAMIYYTGNNMFNRRIRLSAIKQSMRLNEKGLYSLNESGARELLEGHDERRIFALLGWSWREPHERRW